MKTNKDPRHLQRIKVMQSLYAWDFNQKSQPDQETAQIIIIHKDTIDQLIEKAAPAWPLEKINKVDLAILRQAVYELVINSQEPAKVIIDEAVELAKDYGSDSSPSFINGALGKLVLDNNIAA